MEENYKDEMIVIDNVNRYNEIFGLETKHPLVSIIDLTKATTWPTRAWFRYEVYALFKTEPLSVLAPGKLLIWNLSKTFSPMRTASYSIPTSYEAPASDKK